LRKRLLNSQRHITSKQLTHQLNKEKHIAKTANASEYTGERNARFEAGSNARFILNPIAV
jgi:hypothetical protein